MKKTAARISCRLGTLALMLGCSLLLLGAAPARRGKKTAIYPSHQPASSLLKSAGLLILPAEVSGREVRVLPAPSENDSLPKLLLAMDGVHTLSGRLSDISGLVGWGCGGQIDMGLPAAVLALDDASSGPGVLAIVGPSVDKIVTWTPAQPLVNWKLPQAADFGKGLTLDSSAAWTSPAIPGTIFEASWLMPGLSSLDQAKFKAHSAGWVDETGAVHVWQKFIPAMDAAAIKAEEDEDNAGRFLGGFRGVLRLADKGKEEKWMVFDDGIGPELFQGPVKGLVGAAAIQYVPRHLRCFVLK